MRHQSLLSSYLWFIIQHICSQYRNNETPKSLIFLLLINPLFLCHLLIFHRSQQVYAVLWGLLEWRHHAVPTLFALLVDRISKEPTCGRNEMKNNNNNKIYFRYMYYVLLMGFDNIALRKTWLRIFCYFNLEERNEFKIQLRLETSSRGLTSSLYNNGLNRFFIFGVVASLRHEKF